MVTPQRAGRGGVGGDGSMRGGGGIDRRLAPSPPGEGSRKVRAGGRVNIDRFFFGGGAGPRGGG